MGQQLTIGKLFVEDPLQPAEAHCCILLRPRANEEAEDLNTRYMGSLASGAVT